MLLVQHLVLLIRVFVALGAVLVVVDSDTGRGLADAGVSIVGDGDFKDALFFFSSRGRHTRYWRDWSSDVCSSDLQWQALYKSDCKPLVEKLLRAPLDPDGRFKVSALKPIRASWAIDKTVFCGVEPVLTQPPPPGVDVEPMTGAVETERQAYVHAPGTCLSDDVEWPVPCGQPRDPELTGRIDLTG